MQHASSQNGFNIDTAIDSIKSEKSTSTFLDFRSSTRLGEKLVSSSSDPQSGNQRCAYQDLFSNTNEDFFENPKNAESLLKWSVLKNIDPLLGAYGGPNSIHLTEFYILVGTLKGPILVFTRKQFLVSNLVPQLSNDLTENYLRSSVECIAVSADGTHLAAAYKSGDIFLWNLNTSDNSSAGYESDRNTSNDKRLKAIIHIKYHQGRTINGLGFIGLRHTGLIVSDNKGEVMFHNGFRTGLWMLTYSSKQVLTTSSNEILLHSQTAPYSEGETSLHMVAVLTGSAFSILTTNPRLATLYIDKLSSKADTTVVNQCCLLWHKYTSKVAFSINCELTIYSLNIRTNLPNLVSKKATWKSEEPIVSLQWVTDDLIGLLTLSHQFIILQVLDSFQVVTQLDLLPHDLLTPPSKHFAVFQNELFLSTHYSLKIGKFLTWSETALRSVQRGDYIGALKFLGSFLRDDFPLFCLMKLEKNGSERDQQLIVPFYNLALASLRFVLQKQSIDYGEVDLLFSVIIRNLRTFEKGDANLDYTNTFLERSMDCFKDKNCNIFFEVLTNAVMEGNIRALPPEVFKALLEYYSMLKKTSLLEELIIMLNPEMLDVDLAVKLCQDNGLFDILIYIWNKVFGDYTTPLIEAIYKISHQNEKCLLFAKMELSDMSQIFDYLSFILTGRQFPRNAPIVPHQKQTDAKESIYHILFSGTCVELPSKNSEKLHTKRNLNDEPAFPYFNLLLNYNPKRMLSMLNEAFEDSFLNDVSTHKIELTGIQMSRQYIVHVMIDIMKEKGRGIESILLAIFISSNIAKYPQFIRLSNLAFENIITITCTGEHSDLANDSQRALEALLSVYSPKNAEAFIAEVKERNFNQVLFTVYSKMRRYPDLLALALDSNDTMHDYGRDMADVLRNTFNQTKNDFHMKSSILTIVKDNFEVLLIKLGLKDAVLLFEQYDPEIHNFALTVSDEYCRLNYLEELFGSRSNNMDRLNLVTSYMDLCCKYKENKSLLPILHKFPLKSVDFHSVLLTIIGNKNYEGAGVIHERLHDYDAVVEDMLYCIKCWFTQINRKYDSLNDYLIMAVRAAEASEGNKEFNWSRLIACLITLYGRTKSNLGDRDACNKAIQKVFVSLALSETSDRETALNQFPSILTKALENQEVIMRKAHELQELLLDIFTAYNIEEHMSRIILNIVAGSSTSLVQTYKTAIQRGWSVRNGECEVCGKVLWGLGIDAAIFEAWEAARRGSQFSAADGQISPVVLFMCHHGFHENCLQNLGQKKNNYFCLTCKNQTQ